MKVKISTLINIHWSLHYSRKEFPTTPIGNKYIVRNGLVYIGLNPGTTLVFKDHKLIASIDNHECRVGNKLYQTKEFFESLFFINH